ncbi:Autophagy protein 5 [Smittium culicis]|uniref:Autophagy protein 5 n=1 Tax=Smittium culicis TaxID=133412 RepID=A0A1R1XW13_9FUNG|nr:Autophagy protein 5 [Smittium culicis]
MSKGQLSQEIEKRIYEAAIPIRLRLDPTDSIELTSTPSLPSHFQTFHILGHRNSYFPFLFSKIKEQWLIPLLLLENNAGTSKFSSKSHNIDQELGIRENEFWLEYNGTPLKWHYPIGLLYDIEVKAGKKPIIKEKPTSTLEAAIESHMKTHNITKNEKNLPLSSPWDLVLHLRKYPNDKIIKSPSIDLLKSMYMFSLKEADFIRHGSSKRVMELSKIDQTELLDGLSTHKMSTFILVRHLLGLYASKFDWSAIESSPTLKSDKIPLGLPKAIPVKLYFNGSDSFSEDRYVVFQAPVSPIQNTIPINNIFGEPQPSEYRFTTLFDAIDSLINENNSLHNVIYKNITQPSTLPNSNSQGSPMAHNSSNWTTFWDCTLQGIDLSPNIPLLWLSDNLSYPDSFLHIVLSKKK